jgi:hypothetical protein
MGSGGSVAGSLTPCVFCGKTGVKLTNGHIFGQQLLDELPKPGPGVPFLSQIITLDPHEKAWNTIETRDPQSPYHMPVKVICEACNGVWMNTHETAVRDVLVGAQRGATVRLARSPQYRLSLWMTIVSVLSQYLHRSTITTPLIERLYMREYNEPPPGTSVWLARSAEGPSSVVGMVHAIDGRLTDEDDEGTRHRYVYAVIFGPFAGLVIGGLLADGLEPKLKTKPAGVFHRIWPRDSSLTWTADTPRATAMDLDIFRQRIVAFLTPDTPPLTAPLDILLRRPRHEPTS